MDTADKVKNQTGQRYWLKTDGLTEIKMGLKAFQATQLWDMMEQHQPGRFRSMLEAGTLVGFLNRETEAFHQAVTYLIQEKGMPHSEAVEIQWKELCRRTGLSEM